jgi:phosphate transport system substrate-binding protein
VPKEHREQRPGPYGKLLLLAGALLTLLSLSLVACNSSSGGSKGTPTAQPQGTGTAQSAALCPPAGAAKSLDGAGATFPYPLYSKWVDAFKAACGVEVNYQSIGSGGGIKQITQKTVDYGASDAIMTAQQEQDAVAAGGTILHIPMTMGGIAVVVNLPNIQQGQLKLTPDVLANIFLKKITKWNDPAIAQANAGLTLPDTAIAVVHRSDGSGTTFQFTDYLSKVSPDWQSQVGSATSVQWPGDIGGDGNEGVANQVKQNTGAIGYVEVAYAIQSNMTWAAIQNKSGKFVEPTLAAISAAAVGITLPDDMKILIDNSDNRDAYPISGFSWALVYVDQQDKAKAQALVSYLWWSIHDGQQYSEALNYAKLPDAVVTKAEAQIRSITGCDGRTPCPGG